VKVSLVAASVILPLRHAVLRPTLPFEAVHIPEDDLPTTFHIAAHSPAGEVIGCGSFFPASLSTADHGSPADPAPAWALRGMATVGSHRSQGVGGAVLEAGVAEVIRRGGRMLWCKGRTAAGDFYRRHGFVARGGEFDVPISGPHFVFVRPLV
jgi:GNAT superfamily N-acetyltransferase